MYGISLMKFGYELATLGLWLIAILCTLWFVRDGQVFTFLGPLYFICMLGNVMVVRWARRKSNTE